MASWWFCWFPLSSWEKTLLALCFRPHPNASFTINALAAKPFFIQHLTSSFFIVTTAIHLDLLQFYMILTTSEPFYLGSITNEQILSWFLLSAMLGRSDTSFILVILASPYFSKISLPSTKFLISVRWFKGAGFYSTGSSLTSNDWSIPEVCIS